MPAQPSPDLIATAALTGPTSTPGSGGPSAHALLRECHTLYRTKILEMARSALELTGDLFETGSPVPDTQIETFKQRRGDWLALFDRTLTERFAKRIAGERRRGRRPDADASLATLRVLTSFDHDKQAALKAATQFLDRLTQRELAALGARVDVLLPDDSRRDTDNPFAIAYILDALGSSARAVYPDPRVWRPLMERLLADLTPGINKLYISLNRFLADRGVLPEIKAALRARSEFRPRDDRDLLPTFSRMLHAADHSVPADLPVPDILAEPAAIPSLVFATRTAPGAAPDTATQMSTQRILAGLASLAAAGAHSHPAPAANGEVPTGAGSTTSPDADAAFFPSLDPLMALGTSSPLFATLAHWQRVDLPAALARVPVQSATAAGAGAAGIVPTNLVPHIRAAIDSQIANDTDRITMDVIALLFDYVFRDPSIPDGMRRLFGRLQVPIVKAALLDRTFFSDREHPARQLLDHLAEAAVGATGDRDGFTPLATEVVDTICRDFEIDVAVIRAADVRLIEHLEAERVLLAQALTDDVAAALAAEATDGDRSAVRAFLRDRLAGVEVPFDVRAFVETVWAEHLTALRRQHGADSADWAAGVRTLDDLLWSIVAKERTAQKARLTKMIPTLIGALRKGCAAQGVAPERAGMFFESLYGLHMAAIKPAPSAPKAAELPAGAPGVRSAPIEGTAAPAATVATAPGAEGRDPARPALPIEPPGDPARPAPAPPADAKSGLAPPPDAGPAPPATVTLNVHDYVSEMPVGTWLAFAQDATSVHARLSWVSPLRTKYLFTSRSRSRAFVYTPEELAYELGAGKVSLVVEPVPLFDRAVSAALDTLAARQPPARGPLAA